MNAAGQYHVGIVVDDYEGTRAQLSALFGYRWGDEITFALPVTFASGETRELTSRFCYSLGDAPRLEIVRSVPGTGVWEPSTSGLHHFGYWSDDVAGDAALLRAQGYDMEIEGPGPDGVPMFGYYRHPTGARIELVGSASKPLFDKYFIDGRNPFA
jgi:hypothetical protein